MSAIQKLLTEHLDIWTAADTGPKSGRGRSAANAAKVYGISKLRELILELAVRGKLVPQDASDEPASELLKSAGSEREKLVTGGKIKNTKPPSPAINKEESPEIPLGWELVTASEIFISRSGNSKLIKGTLFDQPKPELFPGYSASGQDVWLDTWQHEGTAIIISAVGARCGKAFLAKGKWSAIANTHIVFPLLKIVNEHFSMLVLNNEDFWIRSGGAQPFVKVNETLSRKIALPPFREQIRIVAKVDELMALCDQLEAEHNNATEAHEKLVSHLLGTLAQSQSAEDFSAHWQRIATHFDTLFTTEASIDALKQTLLQLAVMGKLVPQDPNDEPASELLKRIQAKKTKLIAEGAIRKDKPLAPIADEEKRFELPNGWEWVRFNVIANTRLGKMLDKAKNKGVSRQYLRNTNVQWFAFEVDDLKEMRFEDHELDEYRVLPGDLVICEGGEPGRCAIWQGQIEEMFIQKALHRARPWAGVLPEFVQLCLKVDASSGYLDQFFTGATIKHFSGEKLSVYPVPLPSSSEQHRIVAKVDELTTLCDQLKSRLTEAGQLQQKLADVLVENAATEKAPAS